MARKKKKDKSTDSFVKHVRYAHEKGLDQGKGAYPFRLFGAVILDVLRIFWLIIEGPLIVVLVLGIAGSIFVFVKYGDRIKEYSEFADQCVEESTPDTFRMDETTVIYDASGTSIAKLNSSGDSIYLSYEDIPEQAVDAFIAVEDRTFWTNKGVDFKGIIRVMWNYVISSGDEVTGASTITQQLVRTTFLSREVSIERKMKEMMISLRLSKKYTKEDIMEYYVNSACFSNGIYGLEAAAQTYFGCAAADLDLSQIAYLCAIPNRPTYYNPYENPERAITRRDKILDDMSQEGFITEEECGDAKAEKIAIVEKKNTVEYNYETTYATDCAIRYLMKLDGFEFQYDFDTDADYDTYKASYEEQYDLEKNNLYTGGYQIYTSLDSEKQNTLQTILDENLMFNIEENFETGVYSFQGALTTIDNSTGKVIAVIGGRTQDYLHTTYGLNRAYQSYRQPGSSIKPVIIYTPALMNGYSDKTTLYDINVEKAQEQGTDITTLTGTPYSLRSAVVSSKNGCAMQLFNDITPFYGLSFMTDMQFDEIVPSDHVLSAALGGLTHGVTTVQMASAYAAIENEGEFRAPTCIVSMLDNKGKELYEEEKPDQVYDVDASEEMIDILEDVITGGTAASMKWKSSSDIAAAGKTGTTNDNKDGWFCGMTPYYTISVWIGYDTPRSTDDLKGSSYPAAIWKDAMLYLTEDLDAVDFKGE